MSPGLRDTSQVPAKTQQLRTVHGLTVACGVFGGHMQVSLVNDGPVTLIVKKKA